ncbi:MAG: hypothetical protein ACI30H_03550 [Paludibacteraceae bacterium]
MNKRYIINSKMAVVYQRSTLLTSTDVVAAIKMANKALHNLNESTKEFEINIFETLCMRNLSGLVGEYFSRCIMRVSKGNLQVNLHQDGYPDLLLTNTMEKRRYFTTLYIEKNGRKYPKDKASFSPYKYGGIEIKACCGSTPSATITPKPLIGEQRIQLITSFDWKAHHRNTNNLLAVLWDFIDGYPFIVAAFYQNALTPDDWGKIVQPKENGGRTTSVSIMGAKGIKKMCNNWIAVINDNKYIKKLSLSKWIGYCVDSVPFAKLC